MRILYSEPYSREMCLVDDPPEPGRLLCVRAVEGFDELDGLSDKNVLHAPRAQQVVRCDTALHHKGRYQDHSATTAVIIRLN